MTNFKTHERKTAAALGGKRNVGGKGAFAVDVVHSCFSIECKTRKTLPGWLTHGMAQARRAATAEQLPIVVLHRHGEHYVNDVVLIRMSDFIDWFGPVCLPIEEGSET